MANYLVFRHFSTNSNRKLGMITVGVGCASVFTWYVVQQTKDEGVLSLKQMESETTIFKRAVRCEAKNKNVSFKCDPLLNLFRSRL